MLLLWVIYGLPISRMNFPNFPNFALNSSMAYFLLILQLFLIVTNELFLVCLCVYVRFFSQFAVYVYSIVFVYISWILSAMFSPQCQNNELKKRTKKYIRFLMKTQTHHFARKRWNNLNWLLMLFCYFHESFSACCYCAMLYWWHAISIEIGLLCNKWILFKLYMWHEIHTEAECCTSSRW